MINLLDGRFAVRDNAGIQIFDEDGDFLKTVGHGHIGRPFGLATDGKVSFFAKAFDQSLDGNLFLGLPPPLSIFYH